VNNVSKIDTDGVSHLSGQPVEPNGGAGAFRVINDTGVTVTNFSLTLTDTFNASTASVVACGSTICDKFQASKGAAAPAGAGEGLSGPNFVSCTSGAAGGSTRMFFADRQRSRHNLSWSERLDEASCATPSCDSPQATPS
jgi:hypothetical protein